MSWKSLVTASLLCVLASPAFAAPAISQIPGGANASSFLDANGDWVWNIQISNSNPIPGGSSPLAAELGFTASGSALVGASNLSTGANDDFDTANPGTQIFTWETLTDVGGGNMKPVGLQTSVPNNQVFSALGSIDYATVGPHDYIQIKTKGPKTSALSSTLTVSGAYAGKGRIAEANTVAVPPTVNYDTYNNVFTRTALNGDTNLDGHRNGFDVTPFLLGFQAGTGKWFNGDFTGDGLVDGFDTTQLLLGQQGGPPGSGAGLSSVPEPASLLMLALGMVTFVGRRARK